MSRGIIPGGILPGMSSTMIIPLTTDAPIYYRPLGTVALIILNVVVFGMTLASPDLIDRFALPLGQGITPLHWLTSNFLHSGIEHLVGNMIFLWGFGLIVEGKLGWKKFIPLYLAIGAGECVIEQLLFRSEVGVSLGASAAIFGLMAIALLWAPKNDLMLFYWFWIRVGIFEMPILWFALLTLTKSFFFTFALSHHGELVHLLGAAIGTAIGLLLLFWKKVDCEGWDLVTLMCWASSTQNGFSHPYSKTRRRKNAQTAFLRKNLSEIPRPTSCKRFSRLVEQHKPTAAFAEFTQIRHLHPDWHPKPSELLALARGLRHLRLWDQAVQMYEEFLQLRPDFSLGRLELAEILCVQQRPNGARRILKHCDPENFSISQRARLQRIENHVQTLLESGVVELEGPAW